MPEPPLPPALTEEPPPPPLLAFAFPPGPLVTGATPPVGLAPFEAPYPFPQPAAPTE